jgi:pyrroline-5-carboxylate reductase
MLQLNKLAFIGGGNIATALIGGLVGRGFPGARIAVADPNATQCRKLAEEYGVAAGVDLELAVRAADVIVLAVKPQLMRAVAATLSALLSNPPPSPHPLLVSVAAGITHASLRTWYGASVPIVRTMPNRPALIGVGATGLYAPPGVAAAQRDCAEAIMAAVGATVWVDHETQIDTVTAVSGSGPAYFFLLMEAIEAAARDLGLPAEVARVLTLQTALGAAQMARQSTETLASLRDQVTSKGGTTAAALAVLDQADLRGIVARAVRAAEQRSAELAAEFGGA